MDISSLDKSLDNLSVADRALFRRLYTLAIVPSRLRIPESMHSWVISQFGSLEAVTNQRIVRLTNNVSGEETIFNQLRACRPSDTREKEPVDIDSLDMGIDSFDRPELSTSEDSFGRIAGKYRITASNIAKCDELHGLVIFKKFQPLQFTQEEAIDYLDTAWQWAQTAHSLYSQNKYFLFCWNCLWRSGASINHGHAQMMLARGRHYAKIEALRRTALGYRESYSSNYFDDIFKVHRALGCALDKEDTRVLAYLTPVKNNQVMLMADELSLSFKKRVYEVLALFRDRLGVASFNLALTTTPLDKTRENWQGFPVIAWLVDRGELANRSCDIGSLELFAANSVSSDPFKLAVMLEEYL